MDAFTLALLGSTAASAVGGLMGQRASKQAAQEQAQASMLSSIIQAQQADAARQQQEKYFGTAQGGYAPYQQFGQQSMNALARGMGLTEGPGAGTLMAQPTMAQLKMDPSYAFREQQGMKAVQQQMAAGGLGGSGSALKAAQRFGQGLASEEYGNAYNRFMQNRANQINMLQGGTQTGFGAAQGVGNLATGTGTNIANTMIGAGQALGTGLENAATARASGYMGGASALQSALNAPVNAMMAYGMADRFLPQRADYAGIGELPSIYQSGGVLNSIFGGMRR